MTTVLTLFGTRPEAIKLAPVIWAIAKRTDQWRPVNVCSSQHTDLLAPFVRQLNIPMHHDLKVMTAGQAPTSVLSRVIDGLQTILRASSPDLVLVQGDTTTALAGCMAAMWKSTRSSRVMTYNSTRSGLLVGCSISLDGDRIDG